LTLGTTHFCQEPAIHAWQESDSSVVETPITVYNDGQFILAAKAWNVEECVWEYEYALYNMNSDRSAKSFSVPLPTDLSPDDLDPIEASAEFHGISYHSGEQSVHDGTDWDVAVESGSVTWSIHSGSTNALGWGTLYNFRFETERAPNSTLEAVTIELFKSGTPSCVTGDSKVPGALSTGGGACCKGNGCSFTTQSCCTSQSGGFLGTGETCTSPDCNENGVRDECEVRGACCLSYDPNDCVMTPTSECCDALNGVFWYEPHAKCETTDCSMAPLRPQQGP
jgi:hypothetical protein